MATGELLVAESNIAMPHNTVTEILADAAGPFVSIGLQNRGSGILYVTADGDTPSKTVGVEVLPGESASGSALFSNKNTTELYNQQIRGFYVGRQKADGSFPAGVVRLSTGVAGVA